MSRPVSCRFFNTPAGCRRGSSCQFIHGDSSPSQPNNTPIDLPPGHCRYYWSTGNCRLGFNCRYIHQTKPVTSKTDKESADSASDESRRREQDIEKLKPTTNASENCDPTQVHNRLRRFLDSSFRFEKSRSPNREIRAFVALLGNATKENGWTVQDGQMLLTNIAEPGKAGLLRLVEIIHHPQVDVDATASLSRISFQNAYIGLIMYFSSDFVVKSTISRDVNSLYSLIHHDFATFAETVTRCMDKLIDDRDFKDVNTSTHPAYLTGNRIFSALSTVLFEYVIRFKNALAQSPDIIPLIRKLDEWLSIWVEGINAQPPIFQDDWASQTSHESRAFTIRCIKDQVRSLVTIANRAEETLTTRSPGDQPSLAVNDATNAAALAYMNANFKGPGNLRQGGPRHDNDYEDISDIRIAPTHEELTSTQQPYLPSTVIGAPHHLPDGTMEKWLDTQFRLLREELIAPLRTALQCILDDMIAPRGERTMLSTLIEKGGGRYIGGTSGNNKIMFNVYTNCVATKIDFHPQKDIIVDMSLDTPPGSARSNQASSRRKFWEGRGGKRLMHGSLVGLVRGEGASAEAYLGIVSSWGDELVRSSQETSERIRIQINFFDPDILLQTLDDLRPDGNRRSTPQLLIESPVMFETIRPFLEALRREPTVIPFSRYLIPSSSLRETTVDPPKYSISPGFTYDLGCLFKQPPPQPVLLRVDDPASIDACRESLQSDDSRLDPSQANALIDTLSREVSLIQGPPGTGKTYIGIELLRVLKANNVGPILMIAYTNHALDHMLSAVLDSGITKQIVRLGSRSADSHVSQYNLETLEIVQGKRKQSRILPDQFRLLKQTQEDLKSLLTNVTRQEIETKKVEEYLCDSYPEHHESLFKPPGWVERLHTLTRSSDEKWDTVGPKGSSSEENGSQYFGFWEEGGDLAFLRARRPVLETHQSHHPKPRENRFAVLEGQAKSGDGELDVDSLFSLVNSGPASAWIKNWELTNTNDVPPQEASPQEDLPAEELLGEEEQPEDQLKASLTDDEHLEDQIFEAGDVPEMPQTDSSLDELLEPAVSMWSLSKSERRKLSSYWRGSLKETMIEEEREKFDRLRDAYQKQRTDYNEIKDQLKLQLLEKIELVGCTTTGAAKFSALLKSFAPKVLVIEEAGQVLEAHVLGSLVPSIEHLILIGDPLQLRPNLTNHSLSVDSKEGNLLYRFNVSLMERLSTNGLSMSQLEVQRRMHPSISNLIKKTLYPSLQNHPSTTEYPPVKGMAKNIFFMTHEHKDTGGGEDSMSKHNAFEVEMATALVLYLLRQGCYSGDGDIVVLCAYLGQLVRMRDALAGKVITLIDERDQDLIAAHDDGEERDDPVGVERVAVNKKVLLRTVDNFQGEEAKVIILSLVRNSGPSGGLNSGASHPSIGFLKSKNRTNVALSRAQHGLYIMGNARDLVEKSSMWEDVVNTLDAEGCLGNGFPIQCPKHPQERILVAEPAMLSQWAPDGGCLRPCAEPLRCGHVCPYKCHSDDDRHVSVSCLQKCLRQCPKGHPCNKLCSEKCGMCTHPVANTSLSCGHVTSVPCHMIDDFTQLKCSERIEKSYSTCEHKRFIECGESIDMYRCTEPCNVYLECCGRKCQSECGQCQDNNEQTTRNVMIPRTSHCSHPCQRTIFCGHPCKTPCSIGHKCTQRCEERCQRTCEHASCTKTCRTVCAPCAEPCTWSCPHRGTCPLPCGSICMRLPCDKRCAKLLKCGHRCPSLCGEPCSICIICASDEQKADVVDVVMGTTLGEIEPGDSLDTLIITLSCGHTFTVETLDGTCEINSLYSKTEDGIWIGVQDQSRKPDFKKAPVCPTCRTPITIPRYGRAFKRSALDLAELNVALDMSRSLYKLQIRLSTSLSDLDKIPRLGTIKNAVKASHTLPENAKERILAETTRQLHPSNRGKISSSVFLLKGDWKDKKKNAFMIPKAIADLWRGKTSVILKAYEGCIEIAQQRPAHLTAYQNGLSKLYQMELELFAKGNSSSRNPEEDAMRIAKLKVGRPPPRADKRFCVEALWLSIKIRFKLAEFAEYLLGLIDHYGWQSDVFVWGNFIRFIYVSCVQDVEFALEIARESESHRQVVSSNLLKIRADFEQFRFDIEMWRLQAYPKTERGVLVDELAKKMGEAQKYIRATCLDFMSRTREEDDREWLQSNFRDQSAKMLECWEELKNSLVRGTSYYPMPRDEFTETVRAFSFSHAGHWYTCENGHLYAITECGGAMEQKFCPECRAPFGGTGHTWNVSNRRVGELEETTSEEGAAESLCE